MEIKEKIVEKILLLIAFSSISILALIAIFIFGEGLPLIWKVGLKAFILGGRWVPSQGSFGILPMIVGSFWVTLGALLLGIPLGLACAVFLSEWTPPLAAMFLRPAIQLLAAIPSVIYGFWGLVVLVPLVRNYLGGPGLSILSGSLILGFMILPTIISISEDSLSPTSDLQGRRPRPRSYTLADHLAGTGAGSQVRGCGQHHLGDGPCHR